MTLFRAGEWLPDRQTIMAPGLYDVSGLEPVADGWRSVPDFRDVGYSALPSAVRGAARGRTQSGQNYIVAGTDSKLYIALATLFQDQSQPGDYTLSGADRWDFELYGDRILAAAKSEAIQEYLLGSSATFLDLSPDAPFAGSLMTFREFLVAGDIRGRGVNGAFSGEGAIHWSAIGDPTSWPQIGTDAALNVQSDWQPLDGDGGAVVDLVPAGEWALVLRERQTWRMDYVGSPQIFLLRKIDDHRGSLLKNAAIAVGRNVYFLSEEGFMVCDGQSVRPIGEEKVDRYVLGQLNRDRISRMSVTHDADRQTVTWALCFGSEIPNVLLGYKYTLGMWSKLDKTVEWLMTTLATGISLDSPPYATQDMDAPSPGGLGDVDMDTLTGSGKEVLAGFQQDHKLYTFSADRPVLATLTMGDFEAPDQRRALVRWARPVYRGDVPSGSFLNLQGRLRPNEEVDFPSEDFKEESQLGYFRTRVAGRYFRGLVVLGNFFRYDIFEGLDAEFTQLGRR